MLSDSVHCRSRTPALPAQMTEPSIRRPSFRRLGLSPSDSAHVVKVAGTSQVTPRNPCARVDSRSEANAVVTLKPHRSYGGLRLANSFDANLRAESPLPCAERFVAEQHKPRSYAISPPLEQRHGKCLSHRPPTCVRLRSLNGMRPPFPGGARQLAFESVALNGERKSVEIENETT